MAQRGRPRKNSTPPKSFSLQFPMVLRQEAEQACKMSGENSLGNFVRKAVNVYAFMVKRMKDGEKVILEKPDGSQTEIVFF